MEELSTSILLRTSYYNTSLTSKIIVYNRDKMNKRSIRLMKMSYMDVVRLARIVILPDKELEKIEDYRQESELEIQLNDIVLSNLLKISFNPSVVSCHSTWYIASQPHSFNDEPALVSNWLRVWMKNGIIHRDYDRPAIETHDTRYWVQCGRLYRPNKLPSIIQMMSSVIREYWTTTSINNITRLGYVDVNSEIVSRDNVIEGRQDDTIQMSHPSIVYKKTTRNRIYIYMRHNCESITTLDYIIIHGNVVEESVIRRNYPLHNIILCVIYVNHTITVTIIFNDISYIIPPERVRSCLERYNISSLMIDAILQHDIILISKLRF